MTLRSIRNNNPGNLRIGQPWVGLVPREQMTPEQRSETSFCVFRDAAHGFRAMAKLVLSYDKIFARQMTVSKIVHRWAPPNENDTAAYVVAVAKALRVAPDDTIFVTDREVMIELLRAIATHETGSWPAEWDQAVEQGVTKVGM